MVTEQELIQSYAKKYKTEPNSMKQIFTQEKTKGEAIGYTGDNLLNYCKRRVDIWMAKEKLRQGDLYKAVVIGMKSSNFGSQKVFNTATECWNDDPEKATESGLCDDEGHPLYQKGKRQGDIMIPDEFTVKTCYAIIQKIEEGQENPWEKITFNVPQKVIVPLHCITEGAFAKGKGDSYFCNSDSFIVKQELSYDQVLELAKDYFELLKIIDIDTWTTAHEGQYDSICYSIVDLVDMNINNKSPSNMVQVCDRVETDDDIPLIISGWIAKYPELTINIKDGSESLIVFHAPYKDTSNVYGIMAQPQFLKSVTPEKVQPPSEEETPKETTTPKPKIPKPETPKPEAPKEAASASWDDV